MKEILTNQILWTCLSATIIAQILKVIINLITDREVLWNRMVETGGMPSSHSAAVTSLATGMGLSQGFASAAFTISAVFGIIVIYDATGVRRAAGEHAKLLNQLTRELEHLFKEGLQPTTLKTLLGHTYPQVFIGSLLGILIGWVSYKYI